MKRIIVFLLIVFSLCSCMSDKHSEINKGYEIVYDNCGIGDYADKVSDALYINELPILFSDEYQFLGWYKDKEYKVEAALNEKIETDIVLYAKFIAKKLPKNNGVKIYYKHNYITNKYL